MFVMDSSLLHREIAEFRAAGDEDNESVALTLLKDIRRRMTPQPLKIRADVELTCFQYDGVLHIKSAMRAAELVSTEDCKVKMSLVASPLYVLSTQTSEREFGISLVDKAISVLQVRII